MFFKSQKSTMPEVATVTTQADAVNTANTGEIIFDVSIDSFETKVIMASMQQPVLVDFWAPWCGPCKQLMPTLEKLVTEQGGKILLAKVNLDDNQELAAALRVQSVPAVFAFFQGKPIDAFQGNMPESQIKAFLAKVLETARQGKPDALNIPEALKAATQELANKNLQAAHAIYSQILQENNNNAQAYAGLVRTFIAADQIEQAQEMMDRAPEDIQKSPAYQEAKTALEIASMAPIADYSDLENMLDKNPDDHQTRFDLANAQFAGGQQEEAMNNLLTIIEKDREWKEEEARKQLVKYFEALGHTDPLTLQMRKKLSSLLFS